MLLDDDVVSDRKSKSGTFTGRLCRKKGVEHLLFHVSRNTGLGRYDRLPHFASLGASRLLTSPLPRVNLVTTSPHGRTLALYRCFDPRQKPAFAPWQDCPLWVKRRHSHSPALLSFCRRKMG